MYVVIVKNREGVTHIMVGPCDYDQAVEIGKSYIASRMEVSMFPLSNPDTIYV